MASKWKVIDISYYNTVHNYTTTANACDGVIIRLGYRGYGSSGTLVTDKSFTAFYNGFKGKTKLGYYWFSQAINKSEAIAEANYCHSLLSGKQIDMPIYLDSEHANSSGTGRADKLSKSTRTVVTIAWCERMKELGYRVGVYASDSWFKDRLDYNQLLSKKYSIWCAKYSSTPPTYATTYDGWQYTSSDTSCGISRVDASYFYKDIAGWNTNTRISITSYTFTLSKTSYTYNGTARKPTVSCSKLTQGTDYTVVYSNNINAGTATVTITGKGNYKDTVKLTFTIKPKSISSYSISLSGVPASGFIYNGSSQKPTAVSVGSLVLNTDYTVTYSSDTTNVGSVTVTAKAKGNYTGELHTRYVINPKSLIGYTVNINPSVVKYTGSECKPTVTISGLTINKDFTVVYKDNINPGIAMVIVSGKGNYTDYTTGNFEINTFSLNGKTIKLSPESYIYNGSECRPMVSIDGVPDSGYTVSYSNNINAGTATVTVTGKGQWEGTLTKTFIIKPKNIYDLGFGIDEEVEYKYCAQSIKPEVYHPDYMIENIDYTVSYGENKNPGKGSISINGINNYEGTVNIEFDIDYRDIKECIVKIGVATVYSKYRYLDTPVEVYVSYPDGYKLVPNVDYIILNENRQEFIDFTLINLEIKGLGGFSNSYIFFGRSIFDKPYEPTEEELMDDGEYEFGDLDIIPATADGNYDFNGKDIIPDYDISTIDTYSVSLLSDNEESVEEPEPIIEDYKPEDGTLVDFDELSYILLGNYDMDTGTNIDENGVADYDDINYTVHVDDGKYEFGELDVIEPTAVGNYDFGDLDKGVDSDSVANGTYDFNILAGDVEEWLYPGTEYFLNKTPIYANYCSRVASGTKSGQYFIYESTVKNGRVRICRYDGEIYLPCASVGWVSTLDLLNLSKPAVGDQVIVTGRMYKYANGSGGYTEVENETYYISDVVDGAEFQYKYGLASGPHNNRLGFTDESSLTIIYKNGKEYNTDTVIYN